MTPGRPGLEDAKRVPVLDVARALRLEVYSKRFASYVEHSFGPCPSCNGVSRDSEENRAHEKRLRCRVSKDGQGWKCNTNGNSGASKCGEGGDGPGLVNWHLHNHKGPKSDTEAEAVLDWYEANHLLGSGAVWNRGTPVPGPVVSSGDAEAEAPSPVRPPLSEVRDVWERLCVPVTEDAEVSAWLRNRHDGALDPELISWLELAKALKPGVRLPRWCWSKWGRWNDAGHRLIVRWYGPNPNGPGLRTLSLHARNVLPDLPDDVSKGVNPAGYSNAGLVMAWSPGMPFLLPMEAPEAPMLELAEGVPHFLKLALRRWKIPAPGEEGRSTLWGCISGSASDDIAARVPDGWRVAIRTHDDNGGRTLRDAFRRLLAPRCDVRDRLVSNPKRKRGAA